MAIRRKWQRDRQHLPLEAAHRPLYILIHRSFYRQFGTLPELVHCRDFNDKIQWLKLFDQSEEIIRCMDKIRVRDRVRERVGDAHLVTLYQVRNHFAEIDFDALPSSFVIKTNHDSGSVILVRDKATLDRDEAARQIEAALRRRYGWSTGEWAYAYIQPRILIEAFIEPQREAPPPDYKFYCIDGQVRFCHYIHNRGLDTKEQVLDPEGQDMGTSLYPAFRYEKAFVRPTVWREMLRVAERVAQGFKCVRVDLFCAGEQIYVGEMTFWPMSGCYPGDGQKILGQYLDFDRTTFLPPVTGRLRMPDWQADASRPWR